MVFIQDPKLTDEKVSNYLGKVKLFFRDSWFPMESFARANSSNFIMRIAL